MAWLGEAKQQMADGLPPHATPTLPPLRKQQAKSLGRQAGRQAGRSYWTSDSRMGREEELLDSAERVCAVLCCAVRGRRASLEKERNEAGTIMQMIDEQILDTRQMHVYCHCRRTYL